jgi:lactoylglutathione lyase
MHIEHIGLWTNQLERLKAFYEAYFQAQVGNHYHNPAKRFESYFLSFSTGARLELMHQPGIPNPRTDSEKQLTGYAHLSFATGSEQGVDDLTNRLQQDGFQVLDGPRHTGDGYYESVVLDPDGNHIEITV